MGVISIVMPDAVDSKVRIDERGFIGFQCCLKISADFFYVEKCPRLSQINGINFINLNLFFFLIEYLSTEVLMKSIKLQKIRECISIKNLFIRS